MPRSDTGVRPPRGGTRGPVLIPAEVLAGRTAFARALTQLRINAGMSQMTLAKASRVPQGSIGDYEVGVIRPGPTSYAKLLAVLPGLPDPREGEPSDDAPLSPRQLEQAKRQLGIE